MQTILIILTKEMLVFSQLEILSIYIDEGNFLY